MDADASPVRSNASSATDLLTRPELRRHAVSATGQPVTIIAATHLGHMLIL
jgi:hypothetical protein